MTLKVGAPMHTAHPMAMPVAAPFDTRPGLPMSYPVVSRAMIEPTDPAIAHGPGAAAYGNPGTAQPWPMPAAGPAGPEPTPLNAPRERSPEHLIGTLRLTRRSDLQIVLSKLVLPMTILLVAGMLIGGYVGFHGEGVVPRSPTASASEPQPAKRSASVPAPPVEPSQPEPQRAAAPAVTAVAVVPAATGGNPAPDVEPAPANPELLASPAAATPPVEPAGTGALAPPTRPVAPPAPAAAIEIPAAPAAPAEVVAAPPPGSTTAAAPQVLVDVRIDSTPSGATVMLVDRGKTQYVGNTPVSAAVDPSHEYDLVLTYPGEPTTLVHLDPASTRRVAITLGAPASAPKPAEGARHHPERAPPEPPATRRPARQTAEPAGEGTLKISSKPPCEIVIDGKSTGLVTPQLSIALPAGNHRVTLVNREKDIKKTLSVQISANTTEKVIEDFMK